MGRRSFPPMAFARDTESDSVFNLDRLMASVRTETGFKLFFDNGRTLELTNTHGEALARAIQNEVTHPVASNDS